ncbi:Hypothetical protein PHPALM_17971 [Phytophthora palmivora]|uniref:Uncharacterized protein n=1 Tax=Phytophthora palmivora TaxID=4796 RepID=A0A2P4XKY8_9STRA|nr:Hypothetical protein PHPALM_17971 [Phytophthora palmivora]
MPAFAWLINNRVTKRLYCTSHIDCTAEARIVIDIDGKFRLSRSGVHTGAHVSRESQRTGIHKPLLTEIDEMFEITTTEVQGVRHNVGASKIALIDYENEDVLISSHFFQNMRYPIEQNGHRIAWEPFEFQHELLNLWFYAARGCPGVVPNESLSKLTIEQLN